MGINAFGKTSKVFLKAENKNGKTILEDVHFTAPYKIMRPFEKKDGSIEVMLMAASAGIMEGDCQEFQFQIGHGAKVEFRSQSYEKIHQMKAGSARRSTRIEVQAGGEFYFHPQPVIPFADSAFDNRTSIFLEDESAAFFMSEILSAGRSARGEMFDYRFYKNLTEIRRGEKLIYRDNTQYVHSQMPMGELGMYEGYTHMLNIFVTRPAYAEEFVKLARGVLDSQEQIEAGITKLEDGDYVIRALGYRAQSLEKISELLLQDLGKHMTK